MEDNGKKVIQISLSHFIIIVVLLIILICVGIGLYVNVLKKSNIESEMQVIKEKENSIEETLKKEDSVDGEEASSSNETTSINSNEKNGENNKNVSFSEEEVKECLQNYLDLVGAKAGSPSGMLAKLNIISLDSDVKSKGTASSDGYIKSDVPYSKYKNEMMNYVTEEWFNKNFTDYFKNQNGLLYYFDGGATGMQLEVKSVSLKGTRYIAQINNIAMDDSITEENVEFQVDDYNGKCVISYCDI